MEGWVRGFSPRTLEVISALTTFPAMAVRLGGNDNWRHRHHIVFLPPTLANADGKPVPREEWLVH